MTAFFFNTFLPVFLSFHFFTIRGIISNNAFRNRENEKTTLPQVKRPIYVACYASLLLLARWLPLWLDVSVSCI